MIEIYFITYGCTANQNSTEIMKGIVKQAGLNITQNIEFSDIIVINSCIVKEPTQEKIRRQVQDLLKQYPDKKIILTGCMPRLNQKNLQFPNLFLLDIRNIKNIKDLIKDIESNQYDQDKYLKQENETKLLLPKVSKEKFIGITQISEGCLGECNYCIVRLAKGRLFSYSKEKIIQSIESDLQNGCKEIWITSQDCANYGNDESCFMLPELLKEILELPYRFYLRLGMMNPNNVLPILDELIEIYKNPKMFKFLHLPLQSGSNKILNAMNRKYTKQDFQKIISKFKQSIPDITISTDIIVGYPSETNEDFKETFELIEQLKPEILNKSNYTIRPKTPVANLEQIPESIKTKRATQLSKLHLQICNQNQQPFLNQEFKVLVDQKGFSGTFLARNQNYKLFAIPSKEKLLGKQVNVKVKKLSPHYLISEIIE